MKNKKKFVTFAPYIPLYTAPFTFNQPLSGFFADWMKSISKHLPPTFTSEIAGIKPISGPEGRVFYINYKYEPLSKKNKNIKHTRQKSPVPTSDPCQLRLKS